MRRKLQRAARYAAVLLGCLSVLGYLARDPVRDGLGRLAAIWVSRTLQGTLTVGALRGSLLSSLVLRDVQLRDAHGTIVAHLAEVRLHYNLLALLSKRLHLRSIDLVRPYAHLVQTPDGIWNLATLMSSASAAPSPTGWGLPLALDIQRLQIHHGTLALHAPAWPGVQQVDGIEGHIRAQIDAQGMQIHVEQVTAQAHPAEVRLHALHGSLYSAAGTLRLEAFRMQTAQTQITGTGVLPGSAQVASLALDFQPFETAELGRLLQRADLHGPLTLALTAQGPPQAMELRAQLQAAQGQVAVEGGLDMQATPWRYHAQMTLSRADLAALLHRAELQSDINLRMHIEGEGLALTTFQGRIQFEAQPSHLGDLTLLPSQVLLLAEGGRFQVQQCDLQTSAGRLTATGVLDLTGASALQYDLTAQLAQLRSLLGSNSLDGTLHVHGNVQGTGTALRAQGVAQLQRLRYAELALSALQLTYEGTQLGTQPQFAAQLTAQHVSAAGLSVERLAVESFYDPTGQHLQFSAAVRQSGAAEGKLRGTLHWSETIHKLVLQEVSLHLAERAWRLEAPAEITAEAQGWRLGNLTLTHANERVEVAGTFSGTAEQDVRLQLSHLDLTFLQPWLSLPALVQGRASLQARLAGTAAEPRFDAEGSWQPEASRRAPFEQLHVLLRYARQQLHGDIRLRQGQRDLLTLAARLPLDLSLQPMPLAQRLLQAPVTLQLRIQQPELSALSRWQPTWPRLSGALEAELTVQGTYTALELEATGRLQQVGLRGVLQELHTPLHLRATFGLPDTPAESPPGTTPARGILQLRKAVLRLPTLRAQIVGQEQHSHLLQVQNLVAQTSGWWTEGGVEGTLEALQAQVRLATFPLAEVALAARLKPPHMELTRVHVRLPHSEIQGRGRLAWPQLHLRLDIPHLRLDEIGLPPPSPLPSLVRGTVEIRGSVTAPHLETRLQYAGGQLNARLTAQLQDTPFRYNAQLRLDDLDVAALFPGERGRLRLTLQAQGAGLTELQRRADIEMQLDTSNLTFAPGLTARLKGTFSGATVRLEDFSLRSTPAVVAASGTFSADPAQKTSMKYTIKIHNLTPLQPYIGTPWQAQGAFTGTLQGNWPLLQVRSRFDLREWHYATLHGQRVQAELLLTQFPTAPQATLKAQLTALRGPTLPPSSLDIQSTYLASQGTVQLQVTAGPYQKTALEGRFSLASEQRFTVTRLQLRHNGDTWANATPLVLVRSPAGQLDIAQFLIRKGRQEVSAQGILIPNGTLEAQVQLRHVQLLQPLRLLAPQVESLDGQLGLQLALRGTIAQPQVEGRLTITALRWQQHEFGEVAAQFSTVDQALQLEVRWQETTQQFLQASGTVGLAAPHALALHIRAAEVDGRLAQILSTVVPQSRGHLNLDVHLTGTARQPALHGTVTLRDGTVQLAGTGTQYTGVQAEIVLAGTRAEIKQLHAESGNGALDITGWATHNGITLTHLVCTLQAQNFVILHTPELEATLSGAVTVRGTLDDLYATGTITLPRVRAQLGGKLMGGLDAVRPEQLSVESVYGSGPRPALPQESLPESRQRAPLSFLRTDLHLELPQNVWVRGPGTAIELRGALTVTKELAKPFVLGGSVETLRGFASFYSGRFNIERGRVDFTGTPEINPVLDVVATREVSGHIVSIHMAGRATTPQLHLSSTPELQQADIVTLLVVGKTTDRLTAAERRGLSGQAQHIVGNVAAGELEQLLAKPLGFDTVDIQTGENLGESKVSVGRYITQHLFLSYEQQLGEESGNKVGVEYSVNRHLKLKGSSTNKGAAALDLLWRIDY